MPSVLYVPSRVGEGHFTDFQPPAPGATDNGKIWAWNSTTSKFEPVTVSAASPGGSNTHVQFNNGGGFAGDSGFTYAGSGVATLTGRLVVSVVRVPVDSAKAWVLQNAAGTNDILAINSIDGNVGIGKSSGITQKFWLKGGFRLESTATSDYATLQKIAGRLQIDVGTDDYVWFRGSSISTSPLTLNR